MTINLHRLRRGVVGSTKAAWTQRPLRPKYGEHTVKLVQNNMHWLGEGVSLWVRPTKESWAVADTGNVISKKSIINRISMQTGCG